MHLNKDYKDQRTRPCCRGARDGVDSLNDADSERGDNGAFSRARERSGSRMHDVPGVHGVPGVVGVVGVELSVGRAICAAGRLAQ
jgi:hypothetical protein